MAAPTGDVPLKPRRCLDTVTREGFGDLVEKENRRLVKSRDFTAEQFAEIVKPSDIEVVLYDIHSLDSFAACCVARSVLGSRAFYEGVTRGGSEGVLSMEITGKVVAFLGVCWAFDSMHGVIWDASQILVLDTHEMVEGQMMYFAEQYRCGVFVDSKMGAGVMAWNYFYPSTAVPLILRAIEDVSLGRNAFIKGRELRAGLEATLDCTIPDGHVTYGDSRFHDLDKLLQDNNLARDQIQQAISEGEQLMDGIHAVCQSAKQRSSVRLLRLFPAAKAVVVHLCSPFEDQVAEFLVEDFAQHCEGSMARRWIGVVYEIRGHRVRVTLRSQDNGVNVSHIAREFDGCGSQTRAFFTIAVDAWEGIWEQPDIMLMDVPAASDCCLDLKQGESVAIIQRGERFRESVFDEWSWGFKVDEPDKEGWIPTLTHTLFVAIRSSPAPGAGVRSVEEGDLLLGLGMRGSFIWGHLVRPGPGKEARKPAGWYPYSPDLFKRLQPSSVAEITADWND